ncbi:MAG: DNA polymerase III subunit delta [Deltaproteobacteria bacterium]|jgi:DNA polymerase-3 subunit delta|nr:DNA polymerase III subunit delta [Deltaproteobacteria bacterium]
MDIKQFVAEIGSPKRQPLYVIKGADPEAIATAIEAAKGVVNPTYFDFNFESFKSEETEWGQIMEAASTSPFFIPPRVVVIKREKYLVGELEKLSRYLEKPNPDNTILLLSEEPSLRLKFFKEAEAKGRVVDCPAPGKKELPEWLIRQATLKGLNLGIDGARALLNRLGEDLNSLLAELEKLSIYPGGGVKLTAKEIAELVSLGPTAVIYDLGEPLANQALPAGIRALLDLEENTSSMSLSYAFSNHFLRLVKVKSYLESTRPESINSQRPMGLHPYHFRILKEQANRWSWPKLTEGLNAILAAHRGLVTLVSTKPETILEELAVSLGSMLSRGSTVKP